MPTKPRSNRPTHRGGNRVTGQAAARGVKPRSTGKPAAKSAVVATQSSSRSTTSGPSRRSPAARDAATAKMNATASSQLAELQGGAKAHRDTLPGWFSRCGIDT